MKKAPVTNYLIDTSTLFKRYINEPGTKKLDGLFSTAGTFFISAFTIVELITNLKRLNQVDGVIDDNTFTVLKRSFFSDIDKGTIEIEPVTPLIILTAVEFLKEAYITPIDAVQLATMAILQERLGNLVFLSSDHKLLRLAAEKGYATELI